MPANSRDKFDVNCAGLAALTVHMSLENAREILTVTHSAIKDVTLASSTRELTDSTDSPTQSWQYSQ